MRKSTGKIQEKEMRYNRSDDLTETTPDKKVTIVAFLCNWCSYAGADLAGVSRFQYPVEVRVIRLPCSGRVDPLYIFKALQDGAARSVFLGVGVGRRTVRIADREGRK
jgi:F420-non-reducing hydrogenase iron-sulfur subunit